MRKAIFFDRDGVVNIRIVGEYITKPDEFKFWPDFVRLFKKVKEKGYLAIIITNQQGIGKGLMTSEQLAKTHDFMQQELKKVTAYKFDDIFFCSALAKENHPNRKPNPGMLLEAAEKYDIDLKNSYFIGDSPSDVIAGYRAGCKTIMIGNEKPVPHETDFHFVSIDDIDFEI